MAIFVKFSRILSKSLSNSASKIFAVPARTYPGKALYEDDFFGSTAFTESVSSNASLAEGMSVAKATR